MKINKKKKVNKVKLFSMKWSRGEGNGWDDKRCKTEKKHLKIYIWMLWWDIGNKNCIIIWSNIIFINFDFNLSLTSSKKLQQHND